MLTLRLDSLAAVNWLSGNGQALAALPFPQERLSFGGCFTAALAHTFNFSSFRTAFISLTKYELQMGVKILNTHLVCREDRVEVFELCVLPGMVCVGFPSLT